MADFTLIDEQIANLEQQKTQTESLFMKIQGALEALNALKEQTVKAEIDSKTTKTKKINKK